MGSGLFLEDELDVVGLDHELEVLALHKHPPYRALDDGEYSCSLQCREIVNMSDIAEHLLPLVMGHCASPLTISQLVRSRTHECTKQCENKIVKRGTHRYYCCVISKCYVVFN